MKNSTEKAIDNAVKNIIGFGLIVLIVPPFFGTIVKMNQPSESTQYMNGAADRLDAKLKAIESERATRERAEKAKEAEEKAKAKESEVVKP